MTVGRLAAALAAVVLAGCATVAPPPVAKSAGDAYAGRLAIRIEADAGAPARAFSAAFDLRGDAARGSLDLATPLGSRLAEARWAPAEVVLVTPREARRFTDLGSLTREALGESVPVEAWFDWLKGRPWPGAASTPRPDGFSQLGWAVDTAGLDAGRVVARREDPPAVTVRIQLDRP